MPGHFTHVYTARRVADWISGQKEFNPLDTRDGADPVLTGGLDGLTPERCGYLMKKWPIYTNIGAIGPDLFFFCQDYSSGPLAEFQFQDDLIMLAMAIYYWVDKAKDEQWEPLLIILDSVDKTLARIVRFLIKLQKLWDEFIAVWNATIGPIVDSAEQLIDDLTGGLISSASQAFDQLINGLVKIAEEELVTFADIFSWFSLKMRVGWDEQAFVWSDMLHYRRTNQMARNLLAEAKSQFDADGDQDKYEQFQAFALGWICHLGTDTIAHSFVNEQAGGPFRTHWQRHHLVENHIDAWNYRQAGPGGTLPPYELAANDVYPDLSRSAFVFAVALDQDHPNGWPRPAQIPSDPAAAKAAVDQDGFMPDWLANGIVRALIATYHDGTEPEPANLGGGDFQSNMGLVRTKLEQLLNDAGINLNQPLDTVLSEVAPAPDFKVPNGYPLPWEVQTSYRFMISFYRLTFWGGFDLDKPRQPDLIIWPPASDFSDIASAPDFSGVNSSDPVEDVCAIILALFEWLFHEVEAIGKLAGDIIKALVSPGTYPLRWALYQLAMYGWDMVSNAHEILAHTGFVIPHGELTYDNGELRQPNEIDHALIELGNTVDGAFLQALTDANDPFGHLDADPSLIIEPTNPRNDLYPLLPVRPRQVHDDNSSFLDPNRQAPNEFRRPWAYPVLSRRKDGTLYATPTEVSNVDAELDYIDASERVRLLVHQLLGPHSGTTISGPYPAGVTPDQVLFRTDRPVRPTERTQYEQAGSPAETDAINEAVIGRDPGTDHSPLGDPIPFTAYLMGRILDPESSYLVDFNLDADRGYGYRTWDWIRGEATGTDQRGQTYHQPVVQPEGSPTWPGAAPDATQTPIELHYLPPAEPPPPPPPPPPRVTGATRGRLATDETVMLPREPMR